MRAAHLGEKAEALRPQEGEGRLAVGAEDDVGLRGRHELCRGRARRSAAGGPQRVLVRGVPGVALQQRQAQLGGRLEESLHVVLVRVRQHPRHLHASGGHLEPMYGVRATRSPLK